MKSYEAQIQRFADAQAGGTDVEDRLTDILSIGTIHCFLIGAGYTIGDAVPLPIQQKCLDTVDAALHELDDVILELAAGNRGAVDRILVLPDQAWIAGRWCSDES